MKLTFSILILFMTAAHLHGQSYFIAEGQKIKAGTITKSYSFYYQFVDSLRLFFSDSTFIYTNLQNTIVKMETYSVNIEEKHTRIEYFRTDGKDSISRHFRADKLSKIYETRFDDLDRVVYYSLKDYNARNDHSFEWTYEYKDSLTSKGMVYVQTVFVDDNYGEKRFHFRRVLTAGYKDPIRKYPPHANTLCEQTIEVVFPNCDFKEIEKMIERVLIKNRELLTSEECEYFSRSYISTDNKMRLSIVKRKPYWCEGRYAIFSITKEQ